MFVGAPLALAARPLGRPSLFYVGLVLLVIALALPAHPGQTPRERARNLAKHLPGFAWIGRTDRETEGNEEEAEPPRDTAT